MQVRCRPAKVRRSETDVLPLSYTTNWWCLCLSGILRWRGRRKRHRRGRVSARLLSNRSSVIQLRSPVSTGRRQGSSTSSWTRCRRQQVWSCTQPSRLHRRYDNDIYRVAQNGATLSHCKYSENSVTESELRGNWWTSAILYAEHSH